MLTEGYTPKRWRHMSMVFIPKPGKNSYSEPKSYRPITLSSFLLKTLERIIQWWLLRKPELKLLCDQHAFTKGRSTETAIHRVINKIEQNALRGKYAIAVLLDISGAFDNLSFATVNMSLTSLDVHKSIIDWYMALLKGRKITTEVKKVRVERTPTSGTPQGGVLSPIMWNFALNELLATLPKDNILHTGFADDLCLLGTGIDLNTIMDQLQERTDTIVEWGRKNGLSFNPNKTAVIIFHPHKKVKIENITKLIINQQEIGFTSEAKYLGITLDSHLSWKAHIHEKATKAKKLLHLVKKITAKTWGLKPRQVKWIYEQMVRPIMSYGAVFWAHKVNKARTQELATVQRLACLLTLGVMKSTPTSGMEIILNIMPVDLFLQRVATETWTRIKQTSEQIWDGVADKNRIAHWKIWDKIIEDEIKLPHITRAMVREQIWSIPDSIIDDKEDDMVNNLEDLTCYTDGSKQEDGKTGYGWMVSKGDYIIEQRSEGMSEQNTVFEAELMAIYHVINWLRYNQTYITPRILICSDSQAAIKAIDKTETDDRLVKETKEALTNLRKLSKTTLKWVRGHTDTTGNEAADCLAKNGANQETTYCQPFIPIGKIQRKNKIRMYFQQKWEHRWRHDKTCRQTKTFMTKPHKGDTNFILNQDRKSLRQMASWITGHTNLHKHLWVMGKSTNKLCRLCNLQDETPTHLWNDCQATTLAKLQSSTLQQKGMHWTGSLSYSMREGKIKNLFNTKYADGSQEVRSLSGLVDRTTNKNTKDTLHTKPG